MAYDIAADEGVPSGTAFYSIELSDLPLMLSRKKLKAVGWQVLKQYWDPANADLQRVAWKTTQEGNILLFFIEFVHKKGLSD